MRDMSEKLMFINVQLMIINVLKKRIAQKYFYCFFIMWSKMLDEVIFCKEFFANVKVQ